MEEKNKQSYMASYIKSLASIESEIDSFREQKKELRKDYVSSGWLTKEEIKFAHKALSLIKSDVDIDVLRQAYMEIEKTLGRNI
jgi:hypothetical protein|tara:strand:- start:103 stop:354 length:252 start_codon:yes stop_codon:yes gene_type:complete